MKDLKPLPIEYATMSMLAYEASDNIEKIFTQRMPLGWQYVNLITFDGLDLTYLISIHHVRRQVVISLKGTSTLGDLEADFEVFKQSKPNTLPNKLNSMIASSTDSIKKLKDQYPKYDWSFTGHSLGAVLAAILAKEFNSNAVVFDSPGATPFLGGFTNIVHYKAAPNSVNTCHPHSGEAFMIIVPTRPPAETTDDQDTPAWTEASAELSARSSTAVLSASSFSSIGTKPTHKTLKKTKHSGNKCDRQNC